MVTASPYTAAQQGTLDSALLVQRDNPFLGHKPHFSARLISGLAPAAYIYPPYYGYPYYPGYPQPPHQGLIASPTATTTPLSSPSKARELKTPVASTPVQGPDTPASTEAAGAEV